MLLGKSLNFCGLVGICKITRETVVAHTINIESREYVRMIQSILNVAT